MILKTYLRNKNISMATIAREVHVTAQYMWLLCNERTRPSEVLANDIEKFTNGDILASQLRIPEPKKNRPYRRKYKEKQE